MCFYVVSQLIIKFILYFIQINYCKLSLTFFCLIGVMLCKMETADNLSFFFAILLIIKVNNTMFFNYFISRY